MVLPVAGAAFAAQEVHAHSIPRAHRRRSDPYTVCTGCNGPMSSPGHSALPAGTNWHIKCYEASQKRSNDESDIQTRKNQIAGTV